MLTADAGYGDTTAFRLGLTERGIGYVVAVKGATSAYAGDAAPQTAPYAGRGRPPTPRYRDPHQPAGTWSWPPAAPPAKRSPGATAPRPTPTTRPRRCARDSSPMPDPPGQPRHPPADDGSLPEAWLLAEWPTGAEEPTDYWISTLGPDTPLAALVRLAKIRWRIEHDYRELKTGTRT